MWAATKKALKNCWKTHYRRAALISLPISFGMLLYLILSGGYFLPQWFFDLLLPVGFIGSSLSGATYIARPLDSNSQRAEKIGTVIFAGIGLAVTIGVGILAKLSGIPLGNGLGKLAYAVFGLGNISTFAGLGNRLGSTTNTTIPKNERASRVAGAVIGAGIGAALCVCAKTALLSAATLFIPGASIVLPAVLSSVVLGASVSSTGASAFDYASKAYNYARYRLGYLNATNSDKGIDPKILKERNDLRQRIESQPHEYRGSAVGVGLGIAAAIVICICMPHVGAALVGLALTAVVVAGCCSMIGGICSRIGRVIDGFNQSKSKKPTEPHEKDNNDHTALLSQEPTPESSPTQNLYGRLHSPPKTETAHTDASAVLPEHFPSPIAAPKSPTRSLAIQPTPAFSSLVPELAI